MITEQTPHKLKRILFPLLGVILAGLAIVLIALRPGAEEPVPSPEPDFHATAEVGTPLVVDFVFPATTDEEYARMHAACEQYMESHCNVEEQSPAVDVTEDTFIDTDSTSVPDVTPEPNVYTEYDRGYFEDFLMVRYVSENGDIHVVGARLDRTNGAEIKLLDQRDFRSEHFSAGEEESEKKEKKWKFWPNSEQELEEEMEKNGSVSEESFVSCVGQCILDILSSAEDEERVFSHFTEEGEASLLRIMQVMEIDADCSVSSVLAQMGASAPDLETMDRLYLRCKLQRGAEVTYLNFLVKLNENMMIYDVDTI